MSEHFLSEAEFFQRRLPEASLVDERVIGQAKAPGPQLDIPALKAIALRSLVSLLDKKANLFSRRAILSSDGLHREGPSEKRTIIALLGMHRLAATTGSLPFDFDSIRNSALRDTSWVKSIGDLGLLTWFTAESEPEKLEKLFEEFNFQNALEIYADGCQARTRGLAWFLAGIAHSRIACPANLPDLTDIAVDAYHLLAENQSACGIFGHAQASQHHRPPLCRRFGTFSDQIFPIYALTIFARAFEVEEPLASALACANSICNLQGEMGQWWFLYDKQSCLVVNRYPLFSVHQDGTAPLALFALEEATGQSFRDSIIRGLGWVTGGNELGENLQDLNRGWIWDAIECRGRATNYFEGALSLLKGHPAQGTEKVKLRYEARPDHFGWLLYALGRFGLKSQKTVPKAMAAG